MYHYSMSVLRQHEGPRAITWAEFLERVHDKFFLVNYQSDRMNEFITFVQGSKTVEEYKHKFMSH